MGKKLQPVDLNKPANMTPEQARQIARNLKATILHLWEARAIAEQAGYDLAPAVKAIHGLDALDEWAEDTAEANGNTRLVTYLDHGPAWCNKPGGTLPQG